MKMYEVSFENCSNLQITEKDFVDGIVLKFADDIPSDAAAHICIHVERKESHNANAVPGHPKCTYSDCLVCHDVTCMIHQGFEH